VEASALAPQDSARRNRLVLLVGVVAVLLTLTAAVGAFLIATAGGHDASTETRSRHVQYQQCLDEKEAKRSNSAVRRQLPTDIEEQECAPVLDGRPAQHCEVRPVLLSPPAPRPQTTDTLLCE
jgi:hypothetical protein